MTSAQSQNSIKISWASVGAVNSYKIYRSVSSAGPYSVVGIELNTSFTDVGLSPGTDYYYKISAENDCGEGEMSAYFLETTIDCPKPSMPGSVSAEALSSTSIKITWESVSGAISYDIYRSNTADGQYSKIENTASNTFTNDGLLPSTTRYYKIVAINDCGESATSSYASATTQSCPAIAAPTNVFAQSKSSTSIEISWDEVNTAVSYQIYRSTSATGTYSSVGSTTGKENTSYTDEGLSTAQTFYYRVTATSDCTESARSNYTSATTGCDNIPVAPANIRAEALSSTEIKVSWDAVSGLGASWYYNLYTCETPNGEYYYLGNTSSAFTSTTITNREPSTTHYFKISAENDCGEGELSVSAFATTEDCDSPIPADPTGVSAASLSSRSVQITWNTVPGAAYYNVYRTTDKNGSYWTVDGGINLTGNSFTDTTVSALTKYYYGVKSENDCGGTTPYVNSIDSVTTLCETPVPTNVTATAKSSSSIEVSWNAVSGAVSYSVYRSPTVNGTYALIETIANNIFNDTGLSSLTTYHYKVTAKTALCDNSQMSVSVFGTTQ